MKKAGEKAELKVGHYYNAHQRAYREVLEVGPESVLVRDAIGVVRQNRMMWDLHLAKGEEEYMGTSEEVRKAYAQLKGQGGPR